MPTRDTSNRQAAIPESIHETPHLAALAEVRNTDIRIPTTTVDVPAPRNMWVLVGPALVLLGLAQGSGELWMLPKLHAQHGLDFTWIIFYGSLFNIPVLVEAMRTTALTGENPLAFLSRYSRTLALLFLGISVVSLIGNAGFILTVGESIWRMTEWPSIAGVDKSFGKKVWAVVSAVAFALPIWLRLRRIEKYLEIVVGGCALISILILASTFIVRPEFLANLPKFLWALIVPQNLGTVFSVRGDDLTTVVVGFVFMGLGGWYSLFYPLWGKNRGVGIAGDARIQKESDSLSVAGDTKGNHKNVKSWMRAIWVSTTAAIGGNTLTVVLTSLLAYSILHATGQKIGSDWELLTAQASFFKPVLGALAPLTFMIAVGAFFADTWLATYVSLSQLIAETTSKTVPRLKKAGMDKIFYASFIGLSILSLFPLVLPISPGSLILKWFGISNFCAMPIICMLLYVLNYKFLPSVGPAFYKPSRASRIALLTVTTAYVLMTVLYVSSIF